MRIRKHLSAIHLPAVATPVFRRDLSIKHASGSSSSIIIPPPAAAGVSPRIEEHDGKGGVGGGLTAACEALKSAESSSPVGLEAAQEEEAERRQQLVGGCSSSSNKAAGIVKVFSSPRAMIGGTGEEKGDASSMQQQVAILQLDLNSSGAPRTPVSLPTRPKRTKPNPCLKSCSRYYATPQSHQHFQGCMLQEQHQQQQEQEDGVDAAKDCSSPPLPQNSDQVQPKDSDETHTARKTLQLTDIGNDRSVAVEQKRATRRPRRTASMKNLDELDGNNDDQDGLGNQCRRMDGKGWRCHRKTQPDYSLCDYHLDKFRETNQRKLKSNATAQEPARRRRVRRKPVKARSLMSI